MKAPVLMTLAALSLAACSKKPTAMEACKKIEAAGQAANCRSDQPGGLGAGAVEKALFDLPAVAGKTGQVLRFDDDAKFDATVRSFEGAAALAGPHRYGSKRALLFVQANDALPAANGQQLKAVVDSL